MFHQLIEYSMERVGLRGTDDLLQKRCSCERDAKEKYIVKQ